MAGVSRILAVDDSPDSLLQIEAFLEGDEFDAVVLEGAGSPAEVNLKHHDIVNMQMARYADAPVLLAGDIDRGGLFASFVGTMELLTPWERRLIHGFIINRFRGDASLLGPAVDHIFRHTGKPTRHRSGQKAGGYLCGCTGVANIRYSGSQNEWNRVADMEQKMCIRVFDMMKLDPPTGNLEKQSGRHLDRSIEITIQRLDPRHES